MNMYFFFQYSWHQHLANVHVPRNVFNLLEILLLSDSRLLASHFSRPSMPTHVAATRVPAVQPALSGRCLDNVRQRRPTRLAPLRWIGFPPLRDAHKPATSRSNRSLSGGSGYSQRSREIYRLDLEGSYDVSEWNVKATQRRKGLSVIDDFHTYNMSSAVKLTFPS